jgi:hypothetical protein
MTRLPLHSSISVLTSKFILAISLPFLLLIDIFGEALGLKGQNDPVLVLNAKGGEIKAKATGSTNQLRILKIVELEFVNCPKYSYCKIWSLMGENFDYGKKGEFLALDHFFSWNISRFAQTSVFDLEIGKII